MGDVFVVFFIISYFKGVIGGWNNIVKSLHCVIEVST